MFESSRTTILVEQNSKSARLLRIKVLDVWDDHDVIFKDRIDENDI